MPKCWRNSMQPGARLHTSRTSSEESEAQRHRPMLGTVVSPDGQRSRCFAADFGYIGSVPRNRMHKAHDLPASIPRLSRSQVQLSELAVKDRRAMVESLLPRTGSRSSLVEYMLVDVWI